MCAYCLILEFTGANRGGLTTAFLLKLSGIAERYVGTRDEIMCPFRSAIHSKIHRHTDAKQRRGVKPKEKNGKKNMLPRATNPT